MAAVTQNLPPRYNVNGSFREQYYNITIVTSGDTLNVGMNEITSVDISLDNGITAYTVTSNGMGAGSTITFTTSSNPLTVTVTVRGH